MTQTVERESIATTTVWAMKEKIITHSFASPHSK